ncbi:PAS domain-containing protein [Halocynthiibacter sp. C4]|uniref:PAS domain-containing protein n=1 Tax=Halocynthiibacter sp. C4 TaxID=2992758 RepID=UPI00237BDD4C|nr:PAS domain-containing protein [Halocynthiibacter sp. C4]MDE0589607.1 PAS domain-containing protein [Halocynthiibacter sp. C4]
MSFGSDENSDSRDHRNPAENVVRFADLRRRMTDPAITEVRAYWEGLRQGQTVPRRSDVDPRGIQNALEYAFILERIAPRVARIRVAGSHLTDLLGMEVRGMPFTSFFTPSARAEMSCALEYVFEGPRIVELTASAERGIGRPPLTARIVLLPLKSDLGDVSRAMGVLVTRGKIGRTPRRFVIDAVETHVIDGSVSTAQSDAGYRAGRDVFDPKPEPERPVAFSEPSVPFERSHTSSVSGTSNKRRRKPFLRLLTFND